MRFSKLVLLLLCFTVVLSVSVNAQYVKATKYQYLYPVAVQYPTQACNFVVADVNSGSCYRDATKECMRSNSGSCFTQCERNVRNQCITAFRLPSCYPDANAEKQFTSRRACLQGLQQECAVSCSNSREFQSCYSRAQIACSYIGRYFV